MRYRNHEPHSFARYISLGIFFIVCCGIFVARLVFYQIAVRDAYASTVVSDGNVRTVIVQAQRGNICDRNGTIIVTNSYKYDVRIEYGALPEERAEAYEAYLAVLDLIKQTGMPRASELSPFEGSYPDVRYSDEALDPESKIHQKLLYALKIWFVDTKKYDTAQEAYESIDAPELAEHIAKTYDIIEVDKAGNVTYNYSQYDTDRLIALRYDLIVSDFGPVSPYVLVEQVGEQFVSAVKERHLVGITVSAKAERRFVYTKPDGTRYAAHLLGTVGAITEETRDYYTEQGYRLDAKVGRSGCELAFEEYLHGVDGEMAIVEDDRGRIIYTYWIKEPIAGKDVWLTIDMPTQIAAEDALDAKVQATGGSGGAVAATDPKTGEIIALASSPVEQINHALSAYAPGSTFKVGMALAALNEGIIEPNTRIFTEIEGYNGMTCFESLSADTRYSHDSCCGNVNAVTALERSCNFFFGELGDKLGIERIQRYATLFGLGQPTGIEIPEALGFASDNSNLDYMAGIGQLSSFTPLQVTQYISMIANGGTRYSAHLLKYVKNYATGELIYEKTPTVVETLSSAGISDTDIRTVQQGMFAVVNGSEPTHNTLSLAFKSAGYSVAGKTGTAQVSGQRDNALFVGYAPYESPKITVTCFVEGGNNSGNVGSVVRDVMDAYLKPTSSSVG